MSSTCVHISLYAHIHMHKFATSSLYIFIFIHASIYVIFSATTLENSFIWLFGNKSECHHSLYGHEGLPISAITQQSFHDILWHVTKPQLNTKNMSIWRNDGDLLCRSHIYHVYPSGVAIRFLFYLPYEMERHIIYALSIQVVGNIQRTNTISFWQTCIMSSWLISVRQKNMTVL